jgi:PAS domain-containing protein
MHKQTADHSPGADPVSPPPALPEAARRVQPFGTLLLLDATTLRVRRCSADAPALLGTSAEVLLGDSVCKYLTAAAGKELTLFQHGVVPRRETTFTLPALRRRKLPVLMRRSAGVLLVELLHGPGKLAPRAPQSSGEQVARRIGDCHLCLAQTTSVPQLNQQLAALALAHLGYAHVAVLRLEPTHELTLQARADALNEAAAPLDGLRQLHAGLLPIDLLSADDDGYAVIGDSEAENIELLSADPAEAALPVPPSCLLRAPAEAGLGPLRRLGGRSLLAVRLRRRIAPTGSTEPAWGVLLCWAPGPQVPDGVARALAQTLAQLHAQQLSVLSEQQDTRLTELRVRGAIEASGEPICILDLQGNPVLVNAAMAKLTGRPSAALRNRYQLEMLLDGPSSSPPPSPPARGSGRARRPSSAPTARRCSSSCGWTSSPRTTARRSATSRCAAICGPAARPKSGCGCSTRRS